MVQKGNLLRIFHVRTILFAILGNNERVLTYLSWTVEFYKVMQENAYNAIMIDETRTAPIIVFLVYTTRYLYLL